jgi:hypothetical protein
MTVGGSEVALTERAVAQRRRRAITSSDVAAAVALLVLAVLVRGGALPTDGLYRDDAWVVTSVVHGSPAQLLWVGWAHPGFTAILMAWGALMGNDAVRFAYPVFVAGVLSPGLLYLALRWFGYARAIALVLGAALLAATVHIEYSGRVKPYVIDTLVVLGLAVVLPRLDRATWRWPLALIWVAGALVLSSLSGFALVATAVAGLVVVIGSSIDRLVRAAAVGAQGVASVAYIGSTRDSYNTDAVEDFWTRRHDAFPEFTFNPFGLIGELAQHARRVTEVFPGGRGWVSLLWFVVAAAGLVLASARGTNRVRARFLALVLVAAVVAGFASMLPFGAATNGGRVSLWLIPTVAVGLAAVLQPVYARIGSLSRLWRVGLDGTLYVVAAVLALSAFSGTRPTYPVKGSARATEFIESRLGPRDVLLMFPTSGWEYVSGSKLDTELKKYPTVMTGFAPHFKDPRVHVLSTGTAADIERAVAGADRVFTYAAMLAFSDFEPVSSVLEAHGFVEEPGLYGRYSDAAVRVWHADRG